MRLIGIEHAGPSIAVTVEAPDEEAAEAFAVEHVSTDDLVMTIDDWGDGQFTVSFIR